jgi:hypothetical protein
MNRTLLIAGLAVLGSAVLWMVALAQLTQPTYQIPDRSTLTEYTGP